MLWMRRPSSSLICSTTILIREYGSRRTADDLPLLPRSNGNRLCAKDIHYIGGETVVNQCPVGEAGKCSYCEHFGTLHFVRRDGSGYNYAAGITLTGRHGPNGSSHSPGASD